MSIPKHYSHLFIHPYMLNPYFSLLTQHSSIYTHFKQCISFSEFVRIHLSRNIHLRC